jgi:hypothetical protein
MGEKSWMHISRLTENLAHRTRDLLFVQLDAQGFTLRRTTNPLDALADDAMREADREETVPLEALMRHISVELARRAIKH